MTVAILATGGDAQSAAESELTGLGPFRYAETGEKLGRLVAEGGIDAIVTEPADSTGAPVSTFIGPVHSRAPDVPIVVWLTPSPAAFREMPSALAGGVSDCSVRGYDRLRDVLLTALTPGWRPGATTPLLHRLRLLMPADLEEFAIICALKASPRLTPTRVAEWIRVKERTLRDRMQQAALAPPSTFIDYATAVHAAYLLDELGLEPEAVVAQMRFGRTRSMSALLRQYSGRPARALRQHGGFKAMLGQAERALRRPASGSDAEEDLLIDRYLMNQLTPEQQLEFERWLAAAPAGFAEVLSGLRLLIGDAPATEEARRQRQLVWARLRRELGRRFGP